MTDDFAPELFLTRPTVGNRQTKIVQKLNMRESVQKVIEEKRSESILRGNSSSISMKRASSRVSKLSFGGDEIRTYEKVRFLNQKSTDRNRLVPEFGPGPRRSVDPCSQYSTEEVQFWVPKNA